LVRPSLSIPSRVASAVATIEPLIIRLTLHDLQLVYECRGNRASKRSTSEHRMAHWFLGAEQPPPGEGPISLDQIGTVFFEQAVAVAPVIGGNLIPGQGGLLMMSHVEVVVEKQQRHHWIGLDQNGAAADLLMSPVFRIGTYERQRIAPIGDEQDILPERHRT